jgi:hypothetical protein
VVVEVSNQLLSSEVQYVEKLCPDQDPTDRFASRKCKLDELRDVLGDELYQTKLQQLNEEFLKALAL